MSSPAPLFAYAEAAQYLRISRTTLTRAVRRGELTTVRIGRRVMFRLDVIEAFIAACERRPKEGP